MQRRVEGFTKDNYPKADANVLGKLADTLVKYKGAPWIPLGFLGVFNTNYGAPHDNFYMSALDLLSGDAIVGALMRYKEVGIAAGALASDLAEKAFAVSAQLYLPKGSAAGANINEAKFRMAVAAIGDSKVSDIILKTIKKFDGNITYTVASIFIESLPLDSLSNQFNERALRKTMEAVAGVIDPLTAPKAIELVFQLGPRYRSQLGESLYQDNMTMLGIRR